jgi:hypothetical protein
VSLNFVAFESDALTAGADDEGDGDVAAPAIAIPAVESTAAVVAVVRTVRSFMTRASSPIVKGV